MAEGVTDFKVWDELNGTEDDARTIAAGDAQRAAQLFAEQDRDGHTDGLYYGCAQPLLVSDGTTVERWYVEAESVPQFRARRG